MRDLREVLNEAAYDIECAVRAEWGWPDVHPANQRKYDRDIAIVSALREHAEALAAACVQETPMGEAHTTRVTVLEGYRIMDRFTVIGASVFDTIWQASSWLRDFDRDSPNCAPHRVVRVALVDENYPEMPERSTRVTDEMIERAEEEWADHDDDGGEPDQALWQAVWDAPPRRVRGAHRSP